MFFMLVLAAAPDCCLGETGMTYLPGRAMAMLYTAILATMIYWALPALTA
jgi:hypothetical protein